MPKHQLHATALSMFAKCGVQYEFRYLRGIKRPPNISRLIGKATDASVNENLRHKIGTGALLSKNEIENLARDTLVHDWEAAGEVNLEPEYVGLGQEGARDFAIDTSTRLAALHHEKAAPTINPTHVQREWVLDITDLPLELAGTIDIQEGSQAIRDTKTSKKSPVANSVDVSLQLTAYALAVKKIDLVSVEKVALDVLVHTKTPKLVQIEGQKTERDFETLLARIYQVSRALEAGVFLPAPAEAWWCSEAWCGWHNMCPYFSRPVSMAIGGINGK